MQHEFHICRSAASSSTSGVTVTSSSHLWCECHLEFPPLVWVLPQVPTSGVSVTSSSHLWYECYHKCECYHLPLLVWVLHRVPPLVWALPRVSTSGMNDTSSSFRWEEMVPSTASLYIFQKWKPLDSSPGVRSSQRFSSSWRDGSISEAWMRARLFLWSPKTFM